MKPIALLSIVLLLTACTREMGADTYKSTDTVGKVVRGVVLQVEPVKIRDNNSARENSLGTLGGAVAGGAAASRAGQGTGKTVAVAGGAIAGAVIGALIEEELAVQDGFQYVIALNAHSPSSSGTFRTERNEVRRGNASVADDVKQSIRVTQSESEMISVIQVDENPLPVGQPVLVIYHDDRPRVVADRSGV